MAEQHLPDFEDRLRALLARTVEAIPAETDLTERVRQADARDNLRRPSGAAGARPVLAAVAAVMVVALLAGVLTFVRPGGATWHAGGTTATATATSQQVMVVPPVCGPSGAANSPPPAGTPVDHSVAVGHRASLHGITITIDRAYADATQTVLTYHMQTNSNPPLPSIAVLMDAQGHRYGAIFSDWVSVVFTPLPPEELGTLQTLTFFAQQMRLANSTGPGALADGPWQIRFSLTPVAGTSVALSSTPITHNGLSIQPLRLDLAPADGGLDGMSGGMRVVVRLSGLAPGMLLGELTRFDTVFVQGDGAGSFSCGGGALLLVLPDGQQILPGFVHPLGQTIPTTLAEQQGTAPQTVGAAGAADLEVLFFTPIPTGAHLTLYLVQVTVRLAGAPTYHWITGAWVFRLSTDG